MLVAIALAARRTATVAVVARRVAARVRRVPLSRTASPLGVVSRQALPLCRRFAGVERLGFTFQTFVGSESVEFEDLLLDIRLLR